MMRSPIHLTSSKLIILYSFPLKNEEFPLIRHSSHYNSIVVNMVQKILFTEITYCLFLLNDN